jgi:hypothetical protein
MAMRPVDGAEHDSTLGDRNRAGPRRTTLERTIHTPLPMIKMAPA